MSLRTLGWLVRDVFRQARASGLLATLVGATGVVTLACLTAQFSDSGNGTGRLTVLFGAVTVLDGESFDMSARFLQFVLAGVAADTLGVLLALVWTAGLLPAFLDSAAVSVLVAKPPGRAMLLVGRIVGVLLFVAIQATLFVAATWVALGLRTGIWPTGYWLCVPVLLAHFAAFFGVSALLAVSTRSTGACVVGTLVFWSACWGMNYGRHALVGLEVDEAAVGLSRIADLAYWILPKPADFSVILADSIDANRFVTPWIEFSGARAKGLFQPALSVFSSLAFGAVTVAMTIYEFRSHDY